MKKAVYRRNNTQILGPRVARNARRFGLKYADLGHRTNLLSGHKKWTTAAGLRRMMLCVRWNDVTFLLEQRICKIPVVSE